MTDQIQETKVQTDTELIAELRRELAMKTGELEIRNKQIRQAIDVANRINDEKTAQQEAEKLRLIDSIQMDSKFTKDDLKDKSLADLQIMRITLDRSIEKTFASVAAELDEASHKRKPTPYAWDSKKQTWIGGI